MKIRKLIDNLQSVETTKNLGTENQLIDGVVYIQGTDDLKDWLINFSFLGGDNHKGFFDEASILYGKYLRNNVKYIVGHSAGAAIGQQLGYILDKPSIGFGCPRHFSRNKLPLMAKYCDNHTLNLDISIDPVTLVPPWYYRGNNCEKAGKIGHSLNMYKRVYGDYNLEFTEKGSPYLSKETYLVDCAIINKKLRCTVYTY